MHLYPYAYPSKKKAIGKVFCLLVFGALLGINNGWGQVTIASDGFENSLSLFTGSGGTFYSGNSASGDRPATSAFAVAGTYSYGVSNTSATITSSAINTTGYSAISLSLRLASFSIGSTANGADAADVVTIFVSPDNGTTFYQLNQVAGNSNAYWAYAATGTSTFAYTASNQTGNVSTPASGGSRTTDGYSTMTITSLPAASQLVVKITMLNNSTNERWTIDDFKVTGTVSATPSVAISTAHPAAGNISQASSNNIIGSFQLDVTTAAATLTGITVATTGTYQTADIATNGFKFWINSSNNLTGATQLGSAQAAAGSGSSIVVSGLSQNISSGTTRYVLFTADINNNATTSRTIGIGTTAFSNITFSSATKTGTDPAAASNSQTIIGCTPVNVTGPASSSGNTNSSLTWTNPSCFDEILIVAATATNSGTPTGDGTAYTASLTYASGTALGNGYVVYKGSSSSQTVTGLTNGTTYYFKFFTRKGTTWSSGSETNATPTAATAATDYFRSNVATGNWGTAASWQSSADNSSWITSTLVPDNNANTITIRNGHTITVAASVTADQVVVASGGILVANSSLTINDGTGDDLVIQYGGILQYNTNSSFATLGSGTPTVSNEKGGTITVSGTGIIQNIQSTNYIYKDSSILEYSNAGAFSASGTTYFPNVDAATVPIFRIANTIGGNVGGGSATVINGLFQLANGVTISWTGASLKTFRNGITTTGTASMTLGASTGAWQIGNASAGTAEIGGSSGTLTLTNTNGISITATCTATLSSSTAIGGGTFTNNGVLICGTNSLTGAGNFTLATGSTISTASTSGVNGSIAVSGTKTFTATGTTYTFNGNTSTPFPATFGSPATLNINATVVSNQTATLTVTSAVNVNSGGSFALNGTNNLTLNGALIVAVGGTFDNGGESQITNGGGSITINGTFITKDAQGFTGSNTAIPSITPTLGSGCTIVYGLSGDQTITNFAYENLSFSGSGTKSTTGAVSSITGTVTINTGVTVNTGTSTFGGSGTNLTILGTGKLITGGSSTKPNISGTYALDATSTIEFSGSSATIIRSSPSYGNIDISGSNVSLSGTGTSITLQSGSSFTVKSGGTFNVQNVNGFSGGSNTAINNTNSPTISLAAGSTINYNGTAQPITPLAIYSNLTISNSGAKTAASAFTVSGVFTVSGSASLATTSPTFGASGTLAYVDATNAQAYTAGLEWPSSNPPFNVTVNLSGTGSPSVTMPGNRTIDGILTMTAGNMNINGNAITLNGTVTGSGSLIGSASSSMSVGGTGSFGTLNFDQTTDGTTNVLNNFTYNRTSSGTLSLGNKLVVTDVLTPTAGVLSTGGFLHLRGTSSNTARIAQGPSAGGYITGTATVERYMSANGNRAYRLLTPMVTTTNFIRDNWQEGVNNSAVNSNVASPLAGYGTHITGAGGSSNGFDVTQTNAASLYIFDQAIQDWAVVPNTNATVLDAKKGYLLFVRGNRDNINTINTTTGSSDAILRATGTLAQGDQSFASLANTGLLSLVTNPFASPIDWASVYASNASSFENYVTIWTPNGGGRGSFVTITNAGVVAGASGTNLGTVLQSGQAFFVQSTSNAPTLNILESHKATTNNLDVYRLGTQTEMLKAFLYYTDNTSTVRCADGITAVFNNNYNNGVDGNDALQLDNWDEDVAISREGKLLSIESRKLADNNDTIPLAIARLKTQAYQWKFVPANFNAPGIVAALRDNFTNTNTPISLTDTTVVNFTATADPASKAANRFSIVFKQNGTLPVTITQLKAYTKNRGVQVEWQAYNEINIKAYELEKSTDAVHFSLLGHQAATGAGLYSGYDSVPVSGSNYYRVRVVEQSGRASYTAVVKVDMGNRGSFISTYPNPVVSNQVTLQLNNVKKGSYRVSITNGAGQAVYTGTLVHGGGTATELLPLNNALSSGSYQIRVDGDGMHFIQKLLKQ